MPNELGGTRRAALLAMLLLTASADAAPAPWQVWRSKLDGREFCAQTSPGPGWTYERGPFADLHCRQPSKPTGPSGKVNIPPGFPSVDPGQALPRLPDKSAPTR